MKSISKLFFGGTIALYLFTATSWHTLESIPKQPTTKVTSAVKKYLYVITPGIRNYLGYGGHGIHVFDIENNHQWVKFIPGKGGLKKDGTPSNVKGVDVSLTTNCLYISTLEALQCLDLTTEKLLWERPYEGGADRLSISPDGSTIYVPLVIS